MTRERSRSQLNIDLGDEDLKIAFENKCNSNRSSMRAVLAGFIREYTEAEPRQPTEADALCAKLRRLHGLKNPSDLQKRYLELIKGILEIL